jgi:predicted DNA binding CopG/RHH family protein
MERINLYLTEQQIKQIQKDAQKLGISFAEVLRRIIDKYYEAHK